MRLVVCPECAWELLPEVLYLKAPFIVRGAFQVVCGVAETLDCSHFKD